MNNNKNHIKSNNNIINNEFNINEENNNIKEKYNKTNNEYEIDNEKEDQIIIIDKIDENNNYGNDLNVNNYKEDDIYNEEVFEDFPEDTYHLNNKSDDNINYRM